MLFSSIRRGKSLLKNSAGPYTACKFLQSSLQPELATDTKFTHFKTTSSSKEFSPATGMPQYMSSVYWWAYLMPYSPRIFDHPIVVNAILWGNYDRLRDEAIKELPVGTKPVNMQQVACAYGTVMPAFFAALPGGSRFDVIDISTVQLDVAAKKIVESYTVVKESEVDTVIDAFDSRLYHESILRDEHNQERTLSLRHGNAGDLRCYNNQAFDFTLSFFLLHEVPESLRREIVAEMFRLTPAGAKLVFIDYHKCKKSNPVYPIMQVVNKVLEPYAQDLWDYEIEHFFPQDERVKTITKTEYFGGLYQKVVVQL